MARATSAARGDEVSLGSVSGVFGTSGELRLYLHNRTSTLLESWRDVVLVSPEGVRRPARMRARPGAGGRVLATVEGVESPEQAGALMGSEILFLRASLPKVEPDTWYHADLLGLPVRTASGRELGRIAEIHGAGGTDVWVIRGPDGDTYIPVLKVNLVSVKLGQGVVVTDEAVPETL